MSGEMSPSHDGRETAMSARSHRGARPTPALWPRLVLILVSIVVGTLVAETALRVVYGTPPWREPQVQFRDRSYGYGLEPLQRGTFTLGSPVSTNSHGFRDREWTRSREAGTVRVMVLGDSMTFGVGVTADEAYPRLLDARLNETGGRVETLNLGVPGWTTARQAAFFAAEGLSHAPSIVVIGFFINDFTFPPPSRTLSGYTPVAGWPSAPNIALLKRSALFRFTRDRAARLLGPNHVGDLLVAEPHSDQRTQYTYDKLAAIKELCDRDGIPLLLAHIPSVEQIAARRERPPVLGHLEAFAASLDVTFVDLEDSFLEREQPRELYLHPWDGHLSAAGHVAAAEQIASVLAPLVSRVREGHPRDLRTRHPERP